FEGGDPPSIEGSAFVFGPGAMRGPARENVFRLDARALRQVLTAENWWRALLATANTSAPPAHINPFRSQGSLDPGHRLFVGRQSIRSDFSRNITRRHFLLLGSRRIGKTSLMNQLYHDLYRNK